MVKIHLLENNFQALNKDLATQIEANRSKDHQLNELQQELMKTKIALEESNEILRKRNVEMNHLRRYRYRVDRPWPGFPSNRSFMTHVDCL